MLLHQWILDPGGVRSFTSPWYWIALAALWSPIVARPLGVPARMVRRARRGGDAQALAELEAAARAGAARICRLKDRFGVPAAAAWAFAVALLAVLGLGYGSEASLAALAFALPAALSALATAEAAAMIRAGPMDAAQIARTLHRHRISTLATAATSAGLALALGMPWISSAWRFG